MEDSKKISQNENEMLLIANDILLLIGFIWRSMKRHLRLVALVFVVVVGFSLAVLPLIPRSYETTARILTNPSQTLINLDPYQGRTSAAELMTSRENLVSIVEEAELLERWDKTRTKIGRLKDRVMEAVFGKKEIDREEKIDNLLYFLERHLRVEVSGNVIYISVNWHDAETAFLIADALVRHFLEDQHKRENAQYLINIANAEKRLENADEKLRIAEANYKNRPDKQPPQEEVVTKTYRPRVSAPVEASASQSSKAEMVSEADILEMERELDVKERAREQLQRTYVQRVGEAKNRLAELKVTMGPNHPDVIKAQRLVEILSSPPPALKELQEEQEKIAGRIKQARLARASASSASSHRVRVRRPRIVRPKEESSLSEEEQERRFEDYQRENLARSIIAEELLNARIEYDAAKSVLNYRFQITQPPKRAKKPNRPNPIKILASAIFAGIFLGIFLSLFFDVKSGIVLESWQVSRILRVPVLGEMDNLQKDRRAEK